MTACRHLFSCRSYSGWATLALLGTALAIRPDTSQAEIFSNLPASEFAPGSYLDSTVYQGGMAFADLDNDGLLDLILLNRYTGRDAPQVLANIGYNASAGTYIFSEQDPLPQSGAGYWASGLIAVGDYDNDGDVDIFASDISSNISGGWLWENNLITDSGSGTAFSFSYRSTEAGLDAAPVQTVGVALGDFDADGDLDLVYDQPSSTKKFFRNQLIETGSAVYQADDTAFPASTDQNNGFDISTVDVNLDGALDVMSRALSTSGTADVLYFNDGLGIFQDATDVSNQRATFTTHATYVYGGIGTSTAWADYDNDGDWDVLIQNRHDFYNSIEYFTRFFVASWTDDVGIPFTFADKNSAQEIGVQFASFDNTTDSGGGVIFGDFDNNGKVDLYVGSPENTVADSFYLNQGKVTTGKPWQFSDLTDGTADEETAITGNTGPGDTETVSAADWDNDGDLDLYVRKDGLDDLVFINGTDQTSTADNFLRVRATCNNRDCIGAVVQIFKTQDADGDRVPDVYRPGYPGAPTVDGIDYGRLSNAIVKDSLVGMRQVQGGMGIGAQNPFVLHFGLPNVSDFYTVRVLFPGGTVVLKDVYPQSSTDTYNGLELSQFVSIDQSDPSEDGDGLPASIEDTLNTDPFDLDSDDDGLMDSYEQGTLLTDPAIPDTDGDGLWDGVELGEVSGVFDMDGEGSGSISGTDFDVFSADADSLTTTDPLDMDTDGDGLDDGEEDTNKNGRYDANATDEDLELNPLDVDTDDDGITDGAEKLGYEVTDVNGTRTYFSLPRIYDSDFDSLNDGLEVGLQAPMIADEDLPAGVLGTDLTQGLFKADEVDEGERTTDPLDDDTDDDGLFDGDEDKNRNGNWDYNLDETDPSQFSSDSGCDGDGAEKDAGTDPLDGTDDSCADPDGDGCDNSEEEVLGTDPYDVDSDGDNIEDCVEYHTGTSPTSQDTDGDGIDDGVEDANWDGSVGPGETDPRDPDSDGDGLDDGDEDQNSNGVLDDKESDPRDPDTDDDGLSDGDEDIDQNGYIDTSKGETQPWNYDTDSDGLPDGLERGVTAPVSPGTDESAGHYYEDSDPESTTNPVKADTDDDGLLDGQEDRNANGFVDANETDPNVKDTDGDGLADGVEDADQNGEVGPTETDPLDADSDDDDLSDGSEINLYGTNPLKPDTDGDGLTDYEEVMDEYGYSTSPLLADTDNDGLKDGEEILVYETNPEMKDTDGDSLSDGDEVNIYQTDPNLQDSDSDGISDTYEVAEGSQCDANNPDTDGDSLLDGQESTDGDCVWEVNQNETNPYDDDTDNDGIMDGPELDPESPYYTNAPLVADTDADSVLDGTEVGLAEPQGDDTDLVFFVADQDPESTTDPRVKDSDGDGLGDGLEDKNQDGAVDEGETDPTKEDTDGDGLTDGQEDANLNGTKEDTETDPLAYDTDGGCENDGSEVENGTNAVDNPDDDACADADADGVSNELERTKFHSDPNDSDTDDDGIPDGQEPGLIDSSDDGYKDTWGDTNGDGTLDTDEDADVDGDGLNSILDADSDDDGVLDGTEVGLTSDLIVADSDDDSIAHTDTSRTMFIEDADPNTTTDPLDPDTDDDEMDDGAEDPNHNGTIDEDELDPDLAETNYVLGMNEDGFCAYNTPVQDSDCDGLTDNEEDYINLYRKQIWADKYDMDSDDDGVIDGDEHNWSIDSDDDMLINLRDIDSDNDGLTDGTEMGVEEAELDEHTDVALGFFFPDADSSTTTSMVNPDTDFGGADDGAEDPNHNGAIDINEEDSELNELDPNDPSDDPVKEDDSKIAYCQSDPYITLDSDCDGLTDQEEILFGSFPSDSDSDDDGLMDGQEDNWCFDGDFDGVIDAMDPDSDGDLILDGTERGVTDPARGTTTDAGYYRPDVDLGATRTAMIDADTDGGGREDGAEDSNQDGAVGSTGSGETNPNNPLDDCEDGDGDRLCDEEEVAAGTDPADRDSDDDGVIDSDEGTRDYPWNSDFDEDGLINALDPDSDNDGILDGTEVGIIEEERDTDTDLTAAFFIPDEDPTSKTKMCNPDSDNDGVDDGAEDPNHNGSIEDDTLTLTTTSCGEKGNVYQDSDCDGLTDDEEAYQLLIGNEVDPEDADSDDDGLLDGEEHNWTCDMDRDGKIDALDADSDADGVLDGTERGLTFQSILVDNGNDSVGGTELSVGNFVGDEDGGETTTYMLIADTDGDGFRDGKEDCNLNGAVDCVETDPNDPSDPVEGTKLSVCDDSDADGLSDHVESILGTLGDTDDSDADGIPDYVEVGEGTACDPELVLDSDSDGTVDAMDTDSDDDGLLDSYEAGDDPSHPATTGACEVIDYNYSAADDLPDYRNPDSDDDSLEDGFEDEIGTDPYGCDTDDGGVDDGTEVLVDYTSPLDPEDDGTGIRGGGCSIGGKGATAPGAPALALLMTVFGLLLGRRTSRRSTEKPGHGCSPGRPGNRRTFDALFRLLIPFALLMVSVPVARAQSSDTLPSVDRFSAQAFRPALDHGAYFTVWDTNILRQWHFTGGLMANYSVNPLVRRDLYNGDISDEVVGMLTTGDIFAGVGLTNFVSLHLSFPISYGEGRVPNIDPNTDVTLGYEPFATIGFGDAWAAAKLQILNPRKRGLGLALIPEFSVPIGATDYFFGEASPTFRTRLAAEVDLGILSAAMNVGYRVRKRVKVQDLLMDDTLEYGVATKVPILEGLDLTAELMGTMVARDFGDEAFNPTLAMTREGTSPLEFLVGAHYVSDFGIVTTLGGGVGLNNGAGAPFYRAFVGLGYRSPLNLDEDGDGIPDRFDKCPKDPENFNGVMDEDGCPEPDTDNDTIVDPVDACPTAAEDFDGFQDEDGCPDLDNDGDGIPDTKDQCPNEPEDKDGFTDSDGCPDMDNDSDGLQDPRDECPNQAEDFDGFEDEDGCPDLDNDDDGLMDSLDKCPNGAEDKDGYEDDDGCPDTDNDNDGILDADDKCPNEAEVINGVDDEDGCPDEGTQLVFVKEDRLVILYPVHFEVNRATIRTDSETLLNQVATTIKANPYIKKIRIEGHTDSDGSDQWNLELSQARAESVRDYLIKHGVKPERLLAVGYGETRPIASNRTVAGKEKNRRVDFIIVEREERIRLQKKKR